MRHRISKYESYHEYKYEHNIRPENLDFWEDIENEYLQDDQNKDIINMDMINKIKKYIKLSIDIFLTDKQKFCYLNYTIYDQKINDIANELGIKPTTAYKHIRIARAKLYILSELFIESCGGQSRYNIIKNKLKSYINYSNKEEQYIITKYLIENSKGLLDIARELGYFPYNKIYSLYAKTRRNIIKNTSLSNDDLVDLRLYNKRKKYIDGVKAFSFFGGK